MATTKNTTTEEAAKAAKTPPVEAAKTEETGAQGLPHDSRLISFGDRFTFTFAHGREVGSIHFDRRRGEIFYKGHNIRNMDLEEWQVQVLEGLRDMLTQNEQGKTFAADYSRTLDKMTLEKRNQADPSGAGRKS